LKLAASAFGVCRRDCFGLAVWHADLAGLAVHFEEDLDLTRVRSGTDGEQYDLQPLPGINFRGDLFTGLHAAEKCVGGKRAHKAMDSVAGAVIHEDFRIHQLSVEVFIIQCFILIVVGANLEFSFHLVANGGFATFKPANFYISALIKGNIVALPYVTSLLAVLDSGDPRMEQILTTLTRIAQAGNHDAQKALGLLYMVGRPVGVDFTRGTEWLKKASDADDVEANYRLGVLLVQNNKDGTDFTAGKIYLQSAAASGNLATKAFYVELLKKSP
jgi:hypothetical protein